MNASEQVTVKCPRCGACAQFHEPFAFLRAAPTCQTAIVWGGWFVVERYPDVLPWQAPKGRSGQHLVHGGDDGRGYAVLHRGVVDCRACMARFVHELTWPDDLWWQWSIRGHLLWACDRAQALQILDYVRATDRPARSIHGPIGSLPSVFLSAKMRGAVVKAMEKTLAAG